MIGWVDFHEVNYKLSRSWLKIHTGKSSPKTSSELLPSIGYQTIRHISRKLKDHREKERGPTEEFAISKPLLPRPDHYRLFVHNRVAEWVQVMDQLDRAMQRPPFMHSISAEDCGKLRQELASEHARAVAVTGVPN